MESRLSDTQLLKSVFFGGEGEEGEEGVEKDTEVSVNDGIVSFKVRSFISSFTTGEPGERYCMIPVKRLKLLNKFLGATINNSKTEFCKKDENLLFSVDKEHYHIDIQLTTTKA